MCVFVCVCIYIYIYIYNGVVLSHKKKAILLFSLSWRDLEGIIDPKKHNELGNRTKEADSQMQRTNYQLPVRREEEGGAV